MGRIVVSINTFPSQLTTPTYKRMTESHNRRRYCVRNASVHFGIVFVEVVQHLGGNGTENFGSQSSNEIFALTAPTILRVSCGWDVRVDIRIARFTHLEHRLIRPFLIGIFEYFRDTIMFTKH